MHSPQLPRELSLSGVLRRPAVRGPLQGRRTVTQMMTRRLCLAIALALLSACTDAPPATKFPQLTYAHLGAFDLDVAQIDIVDAYQPPLAPPNVDHQMPVAPAAAARRWAQDRLLATGTPGRRAVFTIVDGAVTEVPLKREGGLRGALTVEQSERYDAVLTVRLEIFDATGRRLGLAEANAKRSRSVPEDITLAARDKVWFGITETLGQDINGELDRSIRQYLFPYLR